MYSSFVNPRIGKIYLDTGRKPGMSVSKKLYSRCAYIAFCENLHVSMEAQLILKKF